jgi:hypothetical protein
MLSVVMPKRAVYVTQEVVAWVAAQSAGNVMIQSKQNVMDMTTDVRMHCTKCNQQYNIHEYTAFIKADSMANLAEELKWCAGHKHLEPAQPEVRAVEEPGDRKIKQVE